MEVERLIFDDTCCEWCLLLFICIKAYIGNKYLRHSRTLNFCVNLLQIFKLEKKESICNVQKMVTKIIYFKDGGVFIAKNLI